MGHESGAVRREVAALGRLALPIVLTQLAFMLLGVVDLLMVGRVSVEAFDAVALGNLWKVGTLFPAMGLIFGIAPLVSQAHGAGDVRAAGLALQHGIVIALALSVPLALLWLAAGPALVLFGQDPEIAAVAARYVHVQIPSLGLFLVWAALREWLQGRGITWPILAVVLGANVANAGLNWVLIFGNLGAPRLGAVGSGIATGVIQALLPLAMLAWVLLARLHEQAWLPWSRAALDRKALARALSIGGPVALQLALEVWAFQFAVLWAGWLGAAQLAAHTAVMNLASLSFMVPLGIALAATVRVGNRIGAREPGQAQRAAWVALGLDAAVMAAFAVVFLAFRSELPRLYTADAEVAMLAAGILPIAAAFQLFDGTQAVGGGILRGMGRPRPAALFHFLGFYAVGLPLAYFLCFPLGMGLAGIWWGLAAGLGLVAAMLVVFIRRRGPERARPVAEWEA
jgi:MATE family multidrug resistance protein